MVTSARSVSSYNGAEEAQKNIIYEMEKALSVASSTIQRLESDLDAEKHKNKVISNEWDAVSLNAVLMTRHEHMLKQIKTLEQLIEQRELQ